MTTSATSLVFTVILAATVSGDLLALAPPVDPGWPCVFKKEPVTLDNNATNAASMALEAEGKDLKVNVENTDYRRP